MEMPKNTNHFFFFDFFNFDHSSFCTILMCVCDSEQSLCWWLECITLLGPHFQKLFQIQIHIQTSVLIASYFIATGIDIRSPFSSLLHRALTPPLFYLFSLFLFKLSSPSPFSALSIFFSLSFSLGSPVSSCFRPCPRGSAGSRAGVAGSRTSGRTAAPPA